MSLNYFAAAWVLYASLAERAILIAVIAWAAVVIGTFLYIRKARDFSPFSGIGKAIHSLARHTTNVVKTVRNSRFYMPLRGLIKRDPTILMVILFSILVIFLSSQLLRYVTDGILFLLVAVGRLLEPSILSGSWLLLGALINLVLIFFLSMMLLMFISYLFDFLHKISRFASRFVQPLQDVVEKAGIPPTWSFFVLYIIVSIFQQALTGIFRGA